jgi:rod shape-determining protein MreC
MNSDNFLPKQFIFLVLISIFLLLLDFFGLWAWAYRAMRPFAVKVRSSGYRLAHLPDSQESISNDLDQCQMDNTRLKEENLRIRRLLGSNPPIDMTFQTAQIISGRNGQIYLSVGNRDGIEVNMPVVWDKGLLGKIVEVDDLYSKAILVSSGQFEIAVGVWNGSNSVGEENLISAKGVLKGGNQIVVDEVLRDEPVEKGYFVAPLGFPGKFIIGEVVSISDPEGEFKKLVVDWNARTDQPQTVFVVNNSFLP